MSHKISPYLTPGFYDDALAKGRHRDIIGGRWDETGIIQMRMLMAEGLRPKHRLLDIGCGPLRTGCRVVSYLNPGNYWGTDQSLALMQRGHAVELSESERLRLPRAQLVEDGQFAFAGVPNAFDFLLCFAVFTHLPPEWLERGLQGVARHFSGYEAFLFTVFLCPDEAPEGPHRQVDGVVTHPDRTPFHFRESHVRAIAEAAGFQLERRDYRLPRGQILFRASRA